MKNEITEKDIFNFVFYPDIISKEKRKFLESSSDFRDEIQFYSSLKESIGEELNSEIKQKIALKVDAYKPGNFIYLYPVDEYQNRKMSKNVQLAAASPEEKPKVFSKTFYDEEKTYIIKVINYEKGSKVFVFSTQYELIKDFELNILPQNLKYHLTDNSSPLELDFNVEPESISLEFNLTPRT
ncbi:MAG: hypothetical protein H3C40_12405 [Ignavibacterium sp.]|nr:hypothetical protein [Ignavibacterium sp.]